MSEGLEVSEMQKDGLCEGGKTTKRLGETGNVCVAVAVVGGNRPWTRCRRQEGVEELMGKGRRGGKESQRR